MNAKQRRTLARNVMVELRAMAQTDQEKVFAELVDESRRANNLADALRAKNSKLFLRTIELEEQLADMTIERDELSARLSSMVPVFNERQAQRIGELNATLAAASAEITELQAKVEARRKDAERTCAWEFNGDDDAPAWEGACGAVWCFIEGGPVENEMTFCPQCGGKVAIDAAMQPKDRTS